MSSELKYDEINAVGVIKKVTSSGGLLSSKIPVPSVEWRKGHRETNSYCRRVRTDALTMKSGIIKNKALFLA